MRGRPLRLIGALAVLGGALVVSSRRIGPAPALGPFLDPAHGVWSLARSAELPRRAQASVVHLSATVRVEYDDRAVPHIFAANEEDAYRALGYVVARDRLFQLYLQTLAATGRLTEIAGARALPLDRETRSWISESGSSTDRVTRTTSCLSVLTIGLPAAVLSVVRCARWVHPQTRG